MHPRWTRVLARPWLFGLALSASLALSGCGCGGSTPGGAAVAIPPAQPGAIAPPSGEVVVTPGVALDAEHTVGPPIVVETSQYSPSTRG